MNKGAVRRTIVLMLALACNVAEAGAPPQIILQCSSGYQSTGGINAPEDAAVPSQATRVKGTYTVEGNEVVASGEGNFADERYTLCRASSTNYVFSTDCTAQRFQYIADWLNATDLNSVDQFEKKQKNSAYGLDTIIIDRVNPHVDEEKLTNHMRQVYDAKNKKAVVRPFLVSFRYVGDCSLVKPNL
jgi:hypothetical protein